MALCLARNCHFASWAHIFISLLDGLVSLMCCDWHERGSFQSSVITTVWSINITLFYVTFFDGVCLCVCLRVWCSSVYFSTYLLTTSSLQFQSRYAAHTQKLAVHNWQIFANKSLFEIGHSANKWNSNILTMSQYVRCTCRAKTHTQQQQQRQFSCTHELLYTVYTKGLPFRSIYQFNEWNANSNFQCSLTNGFVLQVNVKKLEWKNLWLWANVLFVGKSLDSDQTKGYKNTKMSCRMT